MRRRAEELRLLAEQMKSRSQADVHEPASVARNIPEAAFALGELVWAHEKGWPAWPALVITWESARDLSPLSALPCFYHCTIVEDNMPCTVITLSAWIRSTLGSSCLSMNSTHIDMDLDEVSVAISPLMSFCYTLVAQTHSHNAFS